MMKPLPILLLCFPLLFLATGCTKSSFLDERPDNALVVPSTLPDLQALLDNDFVMNGTGSYGLVPGLGETGADNYYISGDTYTNVLTPLYRNCYVWAKQLYGGEEIEDWNYPYRCIFYANTVLEGLAKIQPTAAEEAQWNEEKGSALFHRAHMLYQLAQVFAPTYDSLTAAQDYGVPLRMESDINEPIHRASVKETYAQIISDLGKAIPLLPLTPLYKTRPSAPAAYALLARTYLSMGDYGHCLLYSDSSLAEHPGLIDYNGFDTTATFPFTKFNDEVMFCAMMDSYDNYPCQAFLNIVDSNLYRSYEATDLRKHLFFKPSGGGLTFCGSYDEEYYFFAGIATDEVLLMRAECRARAGEAEAAMSDINTLLAKRYVTGTFVPLTAMDADDALRIVLRERRKELLMRGLRWTDLRRLNRDSRFAVTLTRVMNGATYTLPPNDDRYVYPIPDKVILFNKGMPQNPR